MVSLASAIPTVRASAIALADGRSIETVEHALAAASARGWSADLVLEVDGPELPLADGAASVWCDDLEGLGPPSEGPAMFISRPWEQTLDGTTLSLRPGGRSVTVWTDFTQRALPSERVTWDGTWENFAQALAPAHTFGFADEGQSLLLAGRARGVDPSSVVVFGADGTAEAGFAQPKDRGEPARHKLLDAIGDLALTGAIIEGGVSLLRPGHARTLQLLRRAMEDGILVRRRDGRV